MMQAVPTSSELGLSNDLGAAARCSLEINPFGAAEE